MASQQPSQGQARPWFRLASIRAIPPPTPQPDPVPPPRPVIRPAFSQTFRAPPPQPQQPTPPPPPPVTATPPPPAPTTPEPAPTRSPPPLARVSPSPQPPRASPSPLDRVSLSPPPPRASPPSLARVSPSPPPPRASPPPLTRVSPPPPPPPASSSMPTSPIIRALAPTTSSMPTSPRKLSSSSVPQSPKPKVSAPSSSVRTSPPFKQSIDGYLLSSTSPKLTSPPPPVPATISAHSPNPSTSPKTITSLAHSPSSSPKIRHISHPPSPLTLPPAQLPSDTKSQPKITQEPEQKKVLLQQTLEKYKSTNTTSNNSNKYVDGTRSTPIKGNREVANDKGNYKKYSDSEDFGMRIITIAGENKGAIMELSPSKKKYNFKNSPQVWSDGENSGKGKYDHKTPSSFVNSNVQGVNNSIIFNASCTHHDPGVHLSLFRNENGHSGIHIKERVTKD